MAGRSGFAAIKHDFNDSRRVCTVMVGRPNRDDETMSGHNGVNLRLRDISTVTVFRNNAFGHGSVAARTRPLSSFKLHKNGAIPKTS